MVEDRTVESAYRLANQIEAVCKGFPTAEVYIALAAILGNAAAEGRTPNFDRLMDLIKRQAKVTFDTKMREIGRGL